MGDGCETKMGFVWRRRLARQQPEAVVDQVAARFRSLAIDSSRDHFAAVPPLFVTICRDLHFLSGAYTKLVERTVAANDGLSSELAEARAMPTRSPSPTA